VTTRLSKFGSSRSCRLLACHGDTYCYHTGGVWRKAPASAVLQHIYPFLAPHARPCLYFLWRIHLTHSPPPGVLFFPPPFPSTQAEALSTLLGHTAVGSWLSSSCGSNGYVLAAAALIVPTVLLPSVEALAALGALGVMAAVTVGCVVSEGVRE